MEKNERLDQILRIALSSDAEPAEELNEKIRCRINEKKFSKHAGKSAAAVLAAAAILIMSVSAFAAWHFLSPKQVAEHMNNDILAAAFEGENATRINKSAVCGDYVFTLLGITSGANLGLYKNSSQDLAQGINPEKTYVVVSIARKDGSPLPPLNDDFYFDNGFIVTPFIKGISPWEVNIFAMNGGYRECLIEGVIYRMLECDSIEMFADRGVYLYVSTGRTLDGRKIIFNEETGEITLNPDNDEAGALFELPLYVNKADPGKAEQYLRELLEPTPEPDIGNDINEEDADTESMSDGNDYPAEEDNPESGDLSWDEEFADGTVVPGSLKEVPIKDGIAYYELSHENLKFSDQFPVEFLFEYYLNNVEPGEWVTTALTDAGENIIAIQYSADENGVLWCRAVMKPKALLQIEIPW